MTPRFDVSESGFMTLPYFIIRDRVSGRNIAQSFNQNDAEFVAVKLNDSGPMPNSFTLHPVMATQLAEFRMRLEHEHGGPLVDDPTVGLLLADLCDFLRFSEGERAVVLGREIILMLNALDTPEQNNLVVIQAT